NVDRAKSVDCLRDQPLAGGRLRHVGWNRENGLAAFLLDHPSRAGQRVPGSPGDGDPRALSGEGAGDRLADSRGPARHERDFAGERQARGNGQAIGWKRRASALMCFAVSMSRSVTFMPASWVQNENDTML